MAKRQGDCDGLRVLPNRNRFPIADEIHEQVVDVEFVEKDLENRR